MDVTVVGAGAVGTYLAIRSNATQVVVRPERKGQLQRHGLKLKGAETRAARPRILAWDEVGTLAGPVFVAVKATELKDALTQLKPHLSAQSPVVLCQNGIGIFSDASAIVPANLLVRMACWLGASVESLGLVNVAGVIRFELAGARSREIAAHLPGLRVVDVEDVAMCEWRKALWNVGLNGLCTIANAPNGALLESVELQRILDQLLAEASEVARREGVALGEKEFEDVYASTKATATNYNSTHRDLELKRRTEIRWLNGAVSRLGKQHKIATPYNDFVADLMSYFEERAARTSG